MNQQWTSVIIPNNPCHYSVFETEANNAFCKISFTITYKDSDGDYDFEEINYRTTDLKGGPMKGNVKAVLASNTYNKINGFFYKATANFIENKKEKRIRMDVIKKEWTENNSKNSTNLDHQKLYFNETELAFPSKEGFEELIEYIDEEYIQKFTNLNLDRHDCRNLSRMDEMLIFTILYVDDVLSTLTNLIDIEDLIEKSRFQVRQFDDYRSGGERGYKLSNEQIITELENEQDYFNEVIDEFSVNVMDQFRRYAANFAEVSYNMDLPSILRYEFGFPSEFTYFIDDITSKILDSSNKRCFRKILRNF